MDHTLIQILAELFRLSQENTVLQTRIKELEGQLAPQSPEGQRPAPPAAEKERAKG